MARFRHGLVVGKFYPPHAGHHLLIDAAAARCREVTVVVAPSSRESVPLPLRLRWLREVHAAAPHVRFVGVVDDHPVDYGSPVAWAVHCAVFRDAMGAGAATVDAVFSSEPYGDELARRFAAVHVAVDLARRAAPVSGTAVRADPVAAWPWLAAPVRAWFARRVVVLGAESTGTTTMARALARHYRLRGGVWSATRWVPEYGRTHTEDKLAALRGADPSASVADLVWDDDDFQTVAVEQAGAEQAAARAGSPVLFCDTDALATVVWQERYLGAATAQVRAVGLAPAGCPPRLYLLTGDDGVPFHDDGWRDGEHLRSRMTGRFRQVLASGGHRWLELPARYPDRLRAAIAACDMFIAEGWQLADPLPENAPGIRIGDDPGLASPAPVRDNA